MSDQPPKERLYYRIGEAAQLLGVESHVLRYWEREFELETHRSPAGQRLYRRQELQLFQQIRALIYDEGYTVQGARQKLEEEQHAGRPSVEATPQWRELRMIHTRLLQLQQKVLSFKKEISQDPGASS